jgi:NAD(P)-dependent dehydrogenase (short-subunit alcohol dehydrogenase family)
MEFSDQVALVTASAGAGIGQATARALAARGAAIVVSDQHARRTVDVAAAIHDEFGVPTLPAICDVTDKGQVADAVHRAIDRFGQIDILVNNAGFDVFQTLEEMDLEAADRIVGINLMGTIYMTKAVLPFMIARRSGRIVNLSSIAASSPDAGDSAAYCASKAAIQAFTRTLAREVGKHGIRVNAIAPSVTLNPFFEKQMPKQYMNDITSKMPLGPTKPEDQAKAILFLLSKDAGMISGATLSVTAGY